MIHIIRFFVLLISFSFFVSTVNAGPIEDVQSLIDKGEYKAAIIVADEHLKKDKRNEKLLLQKGYALVQSEQYDKAVRHYKRVIRQQKKNPEPMNNLGVVYKLQGKTKDAIDQFNKTIKKFPNYPNAYENLGDIYIAMGQAAYQKGLDKIVGNDILTTKRNLSRDFGDTAANSTQAALRKAEELKKQQELEEQRLAEEARMKAEAEAQAKREEQERLQKARLAQEAAQAAQLAPDEQVFEFLRSWITAWSDRNVDGYLSHYSREYQPLGEQTLNDWVERKSQTIANAQYILINLDSIDIDIASPSFATVEFSQTYESDTLNLTSQKRLTLQKYEDDWLIIKEGPAG